MAETIERLRADDFEEAIEVMEHSFGFDPPRAFPTLHPAIYRPTDEWMRCNYAIRREGRIVAVVGVYPRVTAVGDVRLKVAGIGGVCVHPDHRRSGLMKLLMDQAVADILEDADISFLGGQRQRYAYWGYEKCGVNPVFTIGQSNVRHTFAEPPPSLRFERLGESDTDRVVACKDLYEQAAVHGVRPLEDFVKHLLTWYQQPWVALDEADAVVGYLLVEGGGTKINEIAGTSDEMRIGIIRAWLDQKGCDRVAVTCQPDEVPLIRELGTFCESSTTDAARNWRVVDWPKVVTALLQVKRRFSALPEGRVVIDVTEMRLAIEVTGDAVSCVTTDDEPDLVSTALDAHRILFGPEPPSRVVEILDAARALEGWCPLPLGYVRADGV
ncbi:MAG: hypothetical protein CME26_13240 [Gemmatimonadetes bacterium]|nr:hypothetical protein [Gemmatimonadota bacterium]